MPELRYDVFLSYTHTDVARTRSLRNALVKRALRVWWDRQVDSDAGIVGSIEDAMRSARSLVVLVSRAALRKPWIDRERTAAIHLARPIVVVLIGVSRGELVESWPLMADARSVRWNNDDVDDVAGEISKLLGAAARRRPLTTDSESSQRYQDKCKWGAVLSIAALTSWVSATALSSSGCEPECRAVATNWWQVTSAIAPWLPGDMSEGSFCGGVPDGRCISRYIEGQFMVGGLCKNGRMEGSWVRRDIDGTILWQGEFLDGVAVGHWRIRSRPPCEELMEGELGAFVNGAWTYLLTKRGVWKDWMVENGRCVLSLNDYGPEPTAQNATYPSNLSQGGFPQENSIELSNQEQTFVSSDPYGDIVHVSSSGDYN